MKTTKQWLAEIKEDSNRLHHWLVRQYIGERTAAKRISLLAKQATGKEKKHLLTIASQEESHADWVEELLHNRHIPVPDDFSDAENRYWKNILSQANNTDRLYAAGAHAEEMRLLRIRAIVDDKDFDSDIREVFNKILPEEEYHAKTFRSLSSNESLDLMEEYHEEGMKALGLEA